MNLMKDLIEQVEFWSYYTTVNEHKQFELQTEAQNRADELHSIALAIGMM